MNKSIAGYFREYDRRVTAKPKPAIWDAFLAGSGWQASDGPTPGVFIARPAGHKCLWSCSWATDKGLVEPGKIKPLDSMTVAELLGEAVDVVDRLDDTTSLARLLLDFYLDRVADPEYFLVVLKGRIDFHRKGFKDWICPWDPPKPMSLIRGNNYRPGWK